MKRIWIDRDKCLGCKTCELTCAVMCDSLSKTLFGAIAEVTKPMARVAVHGNTGHSFPLQCRHCQAAPCLLACPAGAMQRDAASNVVFVDANRCRGCYMCVMTCPFGCVVPDVTHHVAVKCDLCLHREEPACVASCPTGCLIYGDEADFGRVLRQKRWQIAAFARGEGSDSQVDLDFQREGE